MVIRGIDERDFDRVHAMQTTYLDVEDVDAFRMRVARDPELYLGAMEGDALVGICYGRANPAGDAVLDGICSDLDNGHGRRGIGSALLREFEAILLKRGQRGLSVGSAPDPKVESFYMKNGFHPVEIVAKSGRLTELAREKVGSYEEGGKKRAELKSLLNPDEVIFIFEKHLE